MGGGGSLSWPVRAGTGQNRSQRWSPQVVEITLIDVCIYNGIETVIWLVSFRCYFHSYRRKKGYYFPNLLLWQMDAPGKIPISHRVTSTWYVAAPEFSTRSVLVHMGSRPLVKPASFSIAGTDADNVTQEIDRGILVIKRENTQTALSRAVSGSRSHEALISFDSVIHSS